MFFLVGCNKGDWDVSVKTKPFYKEGVSAPFVVEIKENGKAASGLSVHATFEMVDMDHGTITTKLKEKSEGVYEGKVQLPMEGEWEALLRIKNGKQTVEKLMKMQVKKKMLLRRSMAKPLRCQMFVSTKHCHKSK
ncbi:FixH family protein [Bacillus methanolicus]|uniref:FixH family protein n=1 Tax=Bacillus methanolicus TaxID=1471 RepID=UPI003CD00266